MTDHREDIKSGEGKKRHSARLTEHRRNTKKMDKFVFLIGNILHQFALFESDFISIDENDIGKYFSDIFEDFDKSSFDVRVLNVAISWLFRLKKKLSYFQYMEYSEKIVSTIISKKVDQRVCQKILPNLIMMIDSPELFDRLCCYLWEKNHLNCLKYILTHSAYGFNFFAMNFHSDSTFFQLMLSPNTVPKFDLILSFLNSRYQNPNYLKDKNENNIFMNVAQSSNPELLESIPKKNIDFYSRNSYGDNVLCLYAQNRDVSCDMLKTLLKISPSRDCDIDAMTEREKTDSYLKQKTELFYNFSRRRFPIKLNSFKNRS